MTAKLQDHVLYRRWVAMRQRCSNPRHTSFRYYGAKGITVCPRWDTFQLFLADIDDEIGPLPSPAHQLDRIDGRLGYRPGNVRWVTRSQQNANRTWACPGQSAYRGVTHGKDGVKWVAQIQSHRRVRHLGTFADETDAARAYDAAVHDTHGEYGKLNFPEECADARLGRIFAGLNASFRTRQEDK